MLISVMEESINWGIDDAPLCNYVTVLYLLKLIWNRMNQSVKAYCEGSE